MNNLMKRFYMSHPLSVDEVIHDHIEIISAESGKIIWSLCPRVAEELEHTLLERGEDHLGRLIRYAVQFCENKKMGIDDLSRAKAHISLLGGGDSPVY